MPGWFGYGFPKYQKGVYSPSDRQINGALRLCHDCMGLLDTFEGRIFYSWSSFERGFVKKQLVGNHMKSSREEEQVCMCVFVGPQAVGV